MGPVFDAVARKCFGLVRYQVAGEATLRVQVEGMVEAMVQVMVEATCWRNHASWAAFDLEIAPTQILRRVHQSDLRNVWTPIPMSKAALLVWRDRFQQPISALTRAVVC